MTLSARYIMPWNAYPSVSACARARGPVLVHWTGSGWKPHLFWKACLKLLCHIYTSIAPSQALGLQPGTSPGLFEGCCIWMELTMVEHNHGDPRQRQGDFRGGSQLCAPQIHQTSAVGARWTKDNSEKFSYQVHLILEVSPS